MVSQINGIQAQSELDKIDAMMRELLDTQAEMRAHSDTLEDIVNSITGGEEIVRLPFLLHCWR